MANLQINPTSSVNSMFADIDFFCDTDSTSYRLEDKARNVNQWIYKGITWHIQANKKYKFEDLNNASFPTVTDTLVDGVKQVTLPTGLLTLEAIEVKDAAGNWVRLKILDRSNLHQSITDFEKTPGVPRWYDPVGPYVNLCPAPAAAQMTLTGGIKFHYSRDFDIFTSTDTMPVPPIPSPFQRIGTLGASYDFLIVNGPEERCTRVRSELMVLEKEFKIFTSDKAEERVTSFKPKHRTADYE